jgi:hypothetical protein
MKNIFILASLLLTSTFSYAQFGSLLKGLENAAKEFENAIQQSTQTVPNQSENNKSEVTQQDSASQLCLEVNKLSEHLFGFYENPPTQGRNGRVAMSKYLEMPQEYKDGIKDARFRSVTIKGRTWDNQIKEESLFDNLYVNFPLFAEWFKLYNENKNACSWDKSDEELKNYISNASKRAKGTTSQDRDMDLAFNFIAVWDYKKTMEQDRVQNESKRFSASPDGKLKSLRDHYTSMMAVQDCHDIRKNYVLKYIDTSIFNQARSAMRQIENTAKKEIPGLNTDREWQIATKEYSESAIGQSLSFNKKMPQNYDESIKGMCNIMSMSLLEALPKEAPKRNF